MNTEEIHFEIERLIRLRTWFYLPFGAIHRSITSSFELEIAARISVQTLVCCPVRVSVVKARCPPARPFRRCTRKGNILIITFHFLSRIRRVPFCFLSQGSLFGVNFVIFLLHVLDMVLKMVECRRDMLNAAECFFFFFLFSYCW